jgi:hypothetical protein
MTRTASCCCGKCFLEVAGDPVMNGVCHCRDCKKGTGSAFGWSAYFANSQVLQKRGDLKKYALKGEPARERWFCPDCGSTLFWTWAGPPLPDHIGMAAGCFADNPLPTPSITINNEGRCAWVELPKEWRTSI